MGVLTTKQEFVYRTLHERIAGGEYRVGDALPTELALTTEYGISRTVVRLALRRLESEGLIRRRKGAGSFVTEHARELAVSGAPAVNVAFVIPHGQATNPIHLGVLREFQALRLPGVVPHLLFAKWPDFPRYAASGIDICVLDGCYLETLRMPPAGWAGKTIAFNRSSTQFNYVMTDNYLGGKMMVEHLLQRGHRHIGVIHYGLTLEPDLASRLTGIYAGFSAAGIEPAKEVVINLHDYRNMTPHMAAEEGLMAVRDKRITALIVITDLLVLPIYEVAEQMGLVPGRDFAVVGFDDQPFAQFLEPALTTVRQPLAAIAAAIGRAVNLLTAGNGYVDVCRSKVPPVLVERASSCGPVVAF